MKQRFRFQVQLGICWLYLVYYSIIYEQEKSLLIYTDISRSKKYHLIKI